MSERTPGPLVLGKMGVIKGGPIHHFTNGSDQSQLFMAMPGIDMSHTERDANGAHMVMCWNTHDELVAALRELRELVANDCEVSDASRATYRAALDRVDGVLAEVP
jgi:aminoglycoside phosphotransferase